MSSNVSTLLELYLGAQHGLDVSRVYTFASRTMAIVATILVSQNPVHVFYKDKEFAKKILDDVESLGYSFTSSDEAPSTKADRVSLFLTGKFSIVLLLLLLLTAS